MTDLEDRFVAEARRQGVQPTSAVLVKLAEQLAGSKVDGDSIITPLGSLRLVDAVASYRSAMPDAFGPITTTASPPEGATLTEQYRHELRQRRPHAMPDDFADVRKRVSGLTAKYMDEIAQRTSR